MEVWAREDQFTRRHRKSRLPSYRVILLRICFMPHLQREVIVFKIRQSPRERRKLSENFNKLVRVKGG